VWVDGGYAGRFVRDGQRIWRLVIEVVKRSDQHKGSKGFVVLPRRWVVERTVAWLTKHRPLVRDYETLPETHEAWSGPPASGPSAADWPDDRIQRHALSLHRLAPSHPNGSR
jgi:transposase